MNRSISCAVVLVVALGCGDDDEPGHTHEDSGGPALCGPVGASVACMGPGGCEGGQTCRQDGSFGACDCSASSAPDCAPEGTVAICLGAGGCVGRQTCNDGSFDSCECSEDTSGGAVTALEITAPEAGAVVGGELGIAGTTDGDVASVRVALGNGPFLSAEGTDDWSLRFDASDLPDGLTEIVVQAIGEDGSELRRWIQVRVQNVDPLVGTWFRTQYVDDYNPYCLVTLEANGAVRADQCSAYDGVFVRELTWRREGGDRVRLESPGGGSHLVIATVSDGNRILDVFLGDSRFTYVWTERYERVVGDPPDELDAGL